jgi:DNA polymerase I-like protein with 3'-5' exonuclease and polymerase domains
MPLINTQSFSPSSSHDADQLYNGLDCCITHEVYQYLTSHHNQLPEVYSFALAMQAPAMEMMLRGWKIDSIERDKGIRLLETQLARLNIIVQKYALAIWDKPLNPRSHVQLKSFFYQSMHLPEVWTSKKGVRRLSMDRETLEKLEVYFHARPIIAAILAYRDTTKQLEVLNTAIDNDGRWRTSYNIGGTETGRWSSSKSSEGTGSNIQNINPVLRGMFTADEGFTLVGIDLEQTESRDVGWAHGTILGDWTYLDAVESGDIHTYCTRLIWPEKAWTGDIKKDKAIAEENFYRQFSHRDMSKRGGHLSNYLGSAWTAARSLKVPLEIMEFFRERYLEAFPAFPRWWQWIAQEIQTTNKLTTPFGRERTFFGRTDDDTTLREAIAYVPQSSTADRLNLGLWRIWKYMGSQIELLGQVHDAVYFQVSEKESLGAIIQNALRLLETPLYHHDSAGNTRSLVVPGEAKWGWNWKNMSPENPDGLAKWKGKVDRERTRLLDRRH